MAGCARRLAAMLVIVSSVAGCYPSFNELISADYKARVRRIEGTTLAAVCAPVVRERPDWGRRDDVVFEVSGCTALPILYDCTDGKLGGVRASPRHQGASCQPVVPVYDR
jgi:hypothetical protein